MAVRLDEEGHDRREGRDGVPRDAMAHTFFPDGSPATGASAFMLNGLPPFTARPMPNPGAAQRQAGSREQAAGLMRYKAADIQIDVVLNKKGWHYPQQRMPRSGATWRTCSPQARPGAALLPRQQHAAHRVLAHQPGAELLRARRLPGAHADRHPRPAHPPREVRRHLVGRRRQRLQLRGRHLQPGRGRERIETSTRAAASAPRSTSHRARRNTSRRRRSRSSATTAACPGAQTTIQRWYADPVPRTAAWIGRCARSSPTTTSVRRRTSRPGSTPAWWSSPRARTGGTGQRHRAGTSLDVRSAPTARRSTTAGRRLAGEHPDGEREDSYREFLLEFQDRSSPTIEQNATALPYVRYQDAATPAVPSAWGWADKPAKAISAASGAPPCPPPSAAHAEHRDPDVRRGHVLGELPQRAARLPHHPPGTPPAASADQLTRPLGHVFRSICRTDPALNSQPAGGINPVSPHPLLQFPTVALRRDPTDPYTPLLRAYEGECRSARWSAPTWSRTPSTCTASSGSSSRRIHPQLPAFARPRGWGSRSTTR